MESDCRFLTDKIISLSSNPEELCNRLPSYGSGIRSAARPSLSYVHLTMMSSYTIWIGRDEINDFVYFSWVLQAFIEQYMDVDTTFYTPRLIGNYVTFTGFCKEYHCSSSWMNTDTRTTLLAWYMYHYLLTLPLEVSAIWKSKLSGTTILFIINRYMFMISWTVGMAESFIITQDIKVSKRSIWWSYSHAECFIFYSCRSRLYFQFLLPVIHWGS